MKLDRLHRRLAVLMGLASLLAFAGGSGFQAPTALLAGAGLLLALLWQPSPSLSSHLERIALPLTFLLVFRALAHVFVIRDDVVMPVVDLIFLLLVTEALRSLDRQNDARLYALSFALLLAASAYRPGLLFGLAFVAYVVLATLALMVGHLRRRSRSQGVGERALPPRLLATTVGLSGVILLISGVVFLSFPRVSRGWAGRGSPPAAVLAGFSDRVALGSHGSEITGDPRIYLRVEFPDGPPPNLDALYWRGRSYDHFDGVRWSRSPRLPPSLAPTGWYAGWGGRTLSQTIYATPLEERVLFALHPVVDVEPESRIQPVFDNAGDYLYWGSAAPAYTARSVLGRPSPEELRGAEGRFSPARSFYLQLPPLSPEVRRLADSLLAHGLTRYDQAAFLVRWFRENFTYTLQLPPTPAEATLESFLLERRTGHCEYFSTAMAVLLRTQGVPTREVNGFLGGEWSEFGDYLAVTGNQAHSWVEVWFPGYGWVPFDPTPPAGGAGLSAGAWSWPGRYLLDGLQHRWNKWVLDYSAQTQWRLLEQGRQLLRGSRDTGEGPSRGDWEGIPGWLLASVLLAAAAGGGLLLSRRRAAPPETRVYLRLRRVARRGGAPSHALHSPLALPRYLASVGHPAAPLARAVVDRYLRARFAGVTLEPRETKELREAVSRVRREIRTHPLRPRPG